MHFPKHIFIPIFMNFLMISFIFLLLIFFVWVFLLWIHRNAWKKFQQCCCWLFLFKQANFLKMTHSKWNEKEKKNPAVWHTIKRKNRLKCESIFKSRNQCEWIRVACCVLQCVSISNAIKCFACQRMRIERNRIEIKERKKKEKTIETK